MDEYKNVVCPKKYFQKKSIKYEILNHLHGPNFVFWETALGRFSQQSFFSYFRRQPSDSMHHRICKIGKSST